MKKILIVVQVILFIAITCSVQGFCLDENSVETTVKDNNEYLLFCGYPEDFIDNLTDTTINEIVLLHGDNKIINVICETEYWPDGIADNAKVVIKSVIAEMQSPDGEKIAGESICVYWEWVDNKPLVGGEDFVSVLWNRENLILEGDSFYAEDYWKNNAEDEWKVSDYYRRFASCSLNSLGHYTNLKAFKKCAGGSMAFNLLANSPMKVGSDYNQYFLAEYEHHTNIWIPLLFVSVAIVIVRIIIKSKKAKNKTINA